jgi:hypothetical protein
MKSLLVLFVLSYAIPALALNTAGQYKLEISNGLSGERGQYVFTLNSSGALNVLSRESDYFMMDFNVLPFFKDSDFEIVWGSDEDRHYLSFTLAAERQKLSISKSCSLYYDVPNKLLYFDEVGFRLNKWDAEKSEYRLIEVIQSDDTLKRCQNELERKYLADYAE